MMANENTEHSGVHADRQKLQFRMARARAGCSCNRDGRVGSHFVLDGGPWHKWRLRLGPWWIGMGCLLRDFILHFAFSHKCPKADG